MARDTARSVVLDDVGISVVEQVLVGVEFVLQQAPLKRISDASTARLLS